MHLQNQDIPCFYPKVRVEKIRGGKRVQVLEPLFPGYIFIDMSPTNPVWAKLRSTRGVMRIVSFAYKPAVVPPEVIQQIRLGLDKVAAVGGIRPGQKVELLEGPFKGIEAVFEAYEGEERAVVLISFMQKVQRVKVPVAALG